MTSLEQKDRIKALLAAGHKAPYISTELNLSVHTIRKWQQRIKKGLVYPQRWVVPLVFQ